MNAYEGRAFAHERIDLDGSAFRNCRFTACEMVYSGGAAPEITGCHFDDCNWSFAGSAALTLGFLSAMHGGGFAPLIENTFELARQGHFSTVSAAPAKAPGRDGGAKADHPLMFRIPRILKVPRKPPADG